MNTHSQSTFQHTNGTAKECLNQPYDEQRQPNIFSKTYFLTAGETDTQGQIPLPHVASRMIEIATLHANTLHVGYADLHPHGAGWVLGRLHISMNRYPSINEEYTMSTWIESLKHGVSVRCFKLIDRHGEILGWGKSIWAVMEMKTRQIARNILGDCSHMVYTDEQCPLSNCRISPFQPTRHQNVTFRYSDLDFNGHVNSVRYIEHIMNLWSADFFKSHIITDFEIMFQHESFECDTVVIAVNDTGSEMPVSIKRDETVVVNAKITVRDRSNQVGPVKS